MATLGFLPRKGAQKWDRRSTGPDCQPHSGETQSGDGARSPKACLWGCQGPVCAHPHPGGYRPSSPGGAAGRRMPCGATGAADAKLKFISPTVADS